jgi:glycogen debranching enzyme
VDTGWPAGEGEFRYYGTADATSWFLVLMAATGDGALADELGDAWRGAAEWLAGALADGDGLVRHRVGTWGALTQQGWRDAIDATAVDAQGSGIVRPDGTLPAPPLADVDSQAAAHAALHAAAALSGEARWGELAGELRARLSALGPEVMAIEAGDVAVPGAGSQLGWLLWADALEPAARAAAAERLCEPDVLTDFGLRTLSSESPVFGERFYHRGSVWPFDSWLGWGGLRAAGYEAEAERVRTGVLAAVERLGRSPELYAVRLDGEPDHVPLANREQAWTVGARWALASEWDGRAA